MPRFARLDAVGLLQHVMVHGIEKSDIFLDDKDRYSFLDRLSTLLVKTGTSCFAWALMTNHFHLLLRPEKSKLSSFMRRLLTGYAVTFNQRHNRAGHLFQNRYKSIVCEEEPYLLELVGYIHLNPVRAHLVQGVDALDSYRWSGHAVLMGNHTLPGQVTDEVLSRFGGRLSEARRNYRLFVMEAAAKGHREEFVGGGMFRSCDFLHTQPGTEAFDERILGGGEFVEDVWRVEKDAHIEGIPSLESVVIDVAARYGISTEILCTATKERTVSEARAVACFLALRVLGYSGAAISPLLKISRAGVTVAAKRGEALVKDGAAKDLVSNVKILTTSP
ncbi:transposase [Geomonas subterranea]|uniref:Transposase n=1 Tax=Geomonas subterranea TaxID=2847989 RepID=A0ABX8LHL2_9BACT|nr:MULTISPECIES: transposase [Geomonas]QXE90190.1 transposase [Geomonas subterranea]QXM07684.1 transposase [Geomonas subterranea]